MEQRGPAAFVAELLGTFLLVFFVCVVMILNSPGGLEFVDWAVIGLVHVFVLATLVYTLGGTSGAHFNPAVTAGLATLRKISWADAAFYWVMQLAGAVAAAYLAKLLLGDEGRGADYGATSISQDFLQGAWLPGLVFEAIGTFVLVWAVMGTAVNPRGEKAWAGMTIGMALGLGVMTLGPLTGAAFNPARWFGPAVASGSYADFWVYIVGPLVGGLVAVLGYRALVLEPEEQVGRRPIDTLD